MTEKFTLRNATSTDSAVIVDLIRELAEYEKLAHEAVATPQDIERDLFGENPKAFCVLFEVQGEVAGFALCFYNYSTFLGKPGLYLEDLFIRPAYRGYGMGKEFFRYLAKRALDENCGRIQWSCLDWNEPSIAFYKSMDAVPLDEWIVFRLEGKSIEKLAKSQPSKKAA